MLSGFAFWVGVKYLSFLTEQGRIIAMLSGGTANRVA